MAKRDYVLSEAGNVLSAKDIKPRSYDRFIGQPGVIIDGQAKVDKGLWGWDGVVGEVHVSVEGIVFRNFIQSAVALGWYARVANNELYNNGTGVELTSYSELDKNYIHDNRQYGLTGGSSSDILIRNDDSDNNTSNYCGGTCRGNAGGSKVVGAAAGTYNLTWEGNYVHDNIGVGIWSDINVRTSLYEHNTVVDNSASGILHEISWDAEIRHNTLINNGSRDVGRSCGYGGQLAVNASTNVEAYGNVVVASNGANGICGIDGLRTEGAPNSQTLTSFYAHDNAIFLSSGTTGIVGRLSAASAGSRFANNAYYVTEPWRSYWAWPLGDVSGWTTWHAHGQDIAGSLGRWVSSFDAIPQFPAGGGPNGVCARCLPVRRQKGHHDRIGRR